MKSALVLAACAATFAAPAMAHVTLSVRSAPAGSYYTGAFQVGHGCAGSATTALRVEIPAAVLVAKPQPKAGWTLEIEREPLATPIKGDGGELVTSRAKAFIWRGRLPDDQFDEFGVWAKLPATPDVLVFPAVQTCEQGENRWVDPPAAEGQPRPSRPAPILTLTPKDDDGMGGMGGMDMSHH